MTEFELKDYISSDEGRDDEPTRTFRCGCCSERPVEGAKECEECGALVCRLECQSLLRCEGESCDAILCHDCVTWLECSLTFCKSHAAEHVQEMASMDQKHPGWRIQRCTACGDVVPIGPEKLCGDCLGIKLVLREAEMVA